MTIKTERMSLTKYEVDRMIAEEPHVNNSLLVADLSTLRSMARAVGRRTYKEQFCGVGYDAFDYGQYHLFARNGGVN